MNKWLQSARYAVKGLALALREERNMRIHVVALACVIIAGLLLDISVLEAALIILVCAGVLCAECLNSAVERLLDAFKPRISPQLEGIKDLMAAAVLIMSVAAVAIGLLLFVPRIMQLGSA